MGDSGCSESITPQCASTAQVVPRDQAKEELEKYHLSFLKSSDVNDGSECAILSPIVLGSVLQAAVPPLVIPQFGLLAGISQLLKNFDIKNRVQDLSWGNDPRVFFNVTTPSSTFICGSQGSGKSHTLSCMLENCLIPSKLGSLPKPLTGVVFHYDTFISDEMGSPCEAAFLSSNPAVKVRVLCSPTNIRSIKGTYSRFGIDVHPLEIDQQNLNTKRMLDLMAVESNSGTTPLYMCTVQRILREMRIHQQESGSEFQYIDFKHKILGSGLTPGQLEPLKQRLEMLESFMPDAQTVSKPLGKGKLKHLRREMRGTQWKLDPSCLTIVDLSCPCISPETACALFNICLTIFLEQNSDVGRVVALDEAHKYMNSSGESEVFTNTLLSAVRLQRHLAVRIIISTQEPTVSPALLNLCSTTIVHRFSSPEWLRILHKHLAAATYDSSKSREISNRPVDEEEADDDSHPLFNRIVRLRVGEALLFSPTAIVLSQTPKEGKPIIRQLGDEYLSIRIRARLTEDGGRSVLSA